MGKGSCKRSAAIFSLLMGLVLILALSLPVGVQADPGTSLWRFSNICDRDVFCFGEEGIGFVNGAPVSGVA